MSILLSAALLVSADPTAAQPQSPATAPVEKVAEKKICRVDTSDSTSRLRKRVCLSQTEWDRKESGVEANDLKNMGAK
jgi:hypothetical protein